MPLENTMSDNLNEQEQQLKKDWERIDEQEREDVGLPDKEDGLSPERRKAEDELVAMADQDVMGRQ